ncbi:hypothetical protein D047_2156B, partial [Vibrio parahaemolyticus VPTS-2010_2]
ILTFISKSC